jgi:putative transposase
MSRPLRLEYEGAIWHVTSRGNERREIFRDRNDRSTFLEILSDTVVDARWRLHAYVLMYNHYHLLLETPERTLSRGVKRLNERWAQHFNWRHDRVGHLFQGRFTGILVERETHLLELVRYVVLNPVRCAAVEHAFDYEWSNYRATAGLAPRPHWLEVDWTLSQFHADQRVGTERYREFVAEGRGAKYCPWELVTGEVYLGSKEFCAEVERLIEARSPAPDVPLRQRRLTLVPFEAVISAVCVSFVETRNTLQEKSRRAARKALAQLAREECAMSFREIGRFLRATDWSAAKLASAGRRLEESDPTYRAALENARDELSRVRPGNST